ncbi:MAG: fibronectin type III domain-containing protein, partial [Thermoguttaceae bacterium]|nr:fibronectin type III domain-containing protein [Thermoguttaceae bacterium]
LTDAEGKTVDSGKTTETTITVTGLDPNRVYSMSVTMLGDGRYVDSKATTASGTTAMGQLDNVDGLTISNKEQTTFTATWSAVDNASGYEWTVVDADGKVVDSGEVVASGETTLSVDATVPTANATYTFSVKALGGADYNASLNPASETVTTLQYVLDAPTILDATVVSDASLKFSWSAVENASGYKVAIYDADGGMVRGLTLYKTEFTFNKLKADTTYTFRVWALGSANGEYGNSADDPSTEGVNEAYNQTVLTTKGVFGAPTVDVTVEEETKFTFTFGLEGATEYAWTLTNAANETVASGETTDTTVVYDVVDTGLSTYTLTVYALENDACVAGKTGSATASAFVNAPTDVEAHVLVGVDGEPTFTDAGKALVVVTWADNSKVEQGYRVYVNGVKVAAVAADNTTALLELEQGTTYNDIKVVAFADSFKAASEPAAEPVTTGLAAPTNLDMVDYDMPAGTATLTWTNNAGDKLDGYKVWSRTKAADGSWSDWKQLKDLGADATSRSCSALYEGREIEYKLCAFNGVAESAAVIFNFKGVKLWAPNGMNMSGYDPETGRATLSWTNVEDSNRDAYEVQSRTQNADGTWGAWKSLANLEANASERICLSLNLGQTYEYRIRAVGEDASSVWRSCIFSADFALDAPTNLEMTSYDSAAHTALLTWSDVIGETKYDVMSSVDAGKTWKTLKELDADTTNRFCRSLNVGQSIAYRIRAVNDQGVSDWATIRFNVTETGLQFVDENWEAKEDVVSSAFAELFLDNEEDDFWGDFGEDFLG